MADQPIAAHGRSSIATLDSTEPAPSSDRTEPARSMWSLLDDIQESLAEASATVDHLAYDSEVDRYASPAASVAFRMLDEAATNVRLAATLALTAQGAGPESAESTTAR